MYNWGVGLQYTRLMVTNCTFSANSAERGGAISIEEYTSLYMVNCILWGDTAPRGPEIAMTMGGWVPILYSSFSNVQGGEAAVYEGYMVFWGPGNIDADPSFADPCNADYHLQSQAGRWAPNSQNWVIDGNTSPCIDAGNPKSPIGYEPFPNGGVINMGAYGGVAEASKSYFGEPVCETIVAGDINGDCIVNFEDFAFMALHWLEDNNP